MFNAFSQGLVVFSNQALPIFISTILLGLLVLPALFTAHPAYKKDRKLRNALISGAFFALSLILRLAFIHRLNLPLYFDSAEHWRIIHALQNGSPLDTILPRYYHIGYHLLVALIAKLARIEIAQAMLISGAVLLALLPLPLFVYIQRRTQSVHAALFSAVLAGFAWSTPAFALNWGKYPMLASLLLSSALLVYANSARSRKSILLIVAIISILIHSRTGIFLGLAALSWILAQKITTSTANARRLALGFGLATLLGIGFPVFDTPFLRLTLEPYLLPPGSYVSFIIFLLSPFAYRQAPKDFFFSLFLCIGLLTSLFIPVESNLLGFGKLTLLDRPFVETALYIPLALLGGLGSAWLIQNITVQPLFKKELLYSLLLGAFALYALNNHNYQPSPCCNFVSADDISAIAWIKRNTPADASILIAGDPMRVMPGIQSANLTATDAGIWVSLLAERKTLKAAYSVDFNAKNTKDELCQKGIDYIYAGNQTRSFNLSLHENQQYGYQPVLTLPKTRIYALLGCER